MEPIPANPISSIAHVEGSGTAEIENPLGSVRNTETSTIGLTSPFASTAAAILTSPLIA
jgi:hypothetical protein